MRIQIPVAAYVEYNPATYVEKALRGLGHDAFITQGQVSEEDDPSIDLYFCVDSGGPLVVQDAWASKCAFWFIDSRRNCDPNTRQPDDDSQAKKIFKAGGWVFQAQYEDTLRLKDKGIQSYWLPLAADPDVWSDQPEEEKIYDVAFVGNCFDPVRLRVLEKLGENFNFCWPGIEGAIMEDGARIYRRSRVGFNISSFYGQVWDYDINMRFFEILSCGIPIVTNYVLGLDWLGTVQIPGIYTYRGLDEVLFKVQDAIKQQKNICEIVNSRWWILNAHTYKHRMKTVLGIICG